MFEGLNYEMQNKIQFSIWKCIKDSIEKAIAENDIDSIAELEEGINWYESKIILSSKFLREELEKLKNLQKK